MSIGSEEAGRGKDLGGIEIMADGRRRTADEVAHDFLKQTGTLSYAKQRVLLAEVLSAYAGAWGDVIVEVYAGRAALSAGEE